MLPMPFISQESRKSNLRGNIRLYCEEQDENIRFISRRRFCTSFDKCESTSLFDEDRIVQEIITSRRLTDVITTRPLDLTRLSRHGHMFDDSAVLAVGPIIAPLFSPSSSVRPFIGSQLSSTSSSSLCGLSTSLDFNSSTSSGNSLVAVSPLSTEGAAIMTINNGPWNVLDMKAAVEIMESFKKLEETNECRIVVISSDRNTAKAFSVGFDLNELYNCKDANRLRVYLAAVLDLWFQIYKSHLITVASINGMAVGGGGMLASCCDRRVISQDGVIAFNEVRMGFALPMCVMELLIKLVGFHKAEHTLMTASFLDPEQCLKIGLVERVAPAHWILDVALEESGRLLENYAFMDASVKRTSRKPVIDSYFDRRESILDALVKDIMSAEAQRVLEAFVFKKHLR